MMNGVSSAEKRIPGSYTWWSRHSQWRKQPRRMLWEERRVKTHSLTDLPSANLSPASLKALLTPS